MKKLNEDDVKRLVLNVVSNITDALQHRVSELEKNEKKQDIRENIVQVMIAAQTLKSACEDNLKILDMIK